MFEVFCVECKIYAHVSGCSTCILSVWDVTKHRDRSLSLMGVNWISDGVGIDFTEYVL